MYGYYKPLRNHLRGFNLWSGLGAVYSYMQFLQWQKPLPPELLNAPLASGQSAMRAGLHGHLVELLARELLLNAEMRGGKPFNHAAHAFGAMRMIHQLDDTYWGLHETRSSDIMFQLSRIAFKQFPYQKPITNGALSRYHLLYGHPLIAPLVESEFGLTSTELFQVLLLLLQELYQNPMPPFAFLQGADAKARNSMVALLDRLSKPAKTMRADLIERQTYGVNWAFSFNPLREHPLIHAGNPQSMMCPLPVALAQRLSDGLYFDLIRADDSFGDRVGAAFEDYVGEVAGRIGTGWLEMLGEERWGKPERRSVDWIMQDHTAALFVECKLARLDIASQTELADEPPLTDAIGKLARYVGQVYATLADALDGRYPHWKPDGRPIHPIIVTFHEWFCFGPFFYAHLDKLVDETFTARGLERELLDRYPFSICSVGDFEGLLEACRSEGIDPVLNLAKSPSHRQSILGGFLVERYPGCLSAAHDVLQDGLDTILEGPSRLTGR
ncbi:hypothetical protein [Sphingopyxis sp.]|uniref:hypothetical protein n=1 Tax=Sphingopyxis sp. TaxID=1908224 RepID=UPI003D098684